ncbi:MAG TPA: outer membrane protein assembly factor BamA [Acidiferrobacteraceae bacterium]|nr:outer membrane protein assembly factor BamA [Acidiferrobacteraceae bacterium]
MKKIVFCILLFTQMVMPAVATETFIIKDIRVEGLQRISPGTVFNYLPVKVGDRLDEASSKESIRALFKTGFFKSVSLKRDEAVLVVIVEERPSISVIEVVGNKEFKDEILKDAMKRLGFTEGRVYNPSLLDKVEQELKSQYFSLGKYGAVIKTTVTPLERNRVGIVIEVTEGEKARIKQINIVGNKNFKDEKLLKKFSLKTKKRFRFFSKKDQYSKQKLSADLETLRSFYQDLGYLDFNIDSTQVSITPDKQHIYLTVNIHEGDRYVVSEFKLGGKPLLPQKELLALVTFKPGEVFSRKEVSRTSKLMGDRLADEGYAFANVNAIPELDKEKQTVAFTFFIDPGQRVYVRRINISGNRTTRDEVVRREMRQLEASWFSAAAVRRSRVRLQRLGFFDDINIETPAVPGTSDQVDVNVSVKERATGSLLFGLGYSDADGFLLQLAVSQRNLFGTGKELQVNIDNSQVSDTISIRYVDPYSTDDGISRGLTLFSQRIDASARQANIAEYITETLGGGISYKIPISEFNSVNLGVGFERINLETTASSPPEIATFIAANPRNNIFKINANISHDTRDSYIYPTDGWLHRLALDASIPGSDLEYYKLSYITTGYIPLTKNLIFKVGSEMGYGNGYGGTSVLPFFKNFYAGGASTVRGYRSRTLGPFDSGTTPRALGGSKLILGNVELLFPFPGGADNRDKRLSLFIDAGQVFGASERIELGEIRLSTGIAFNWFSPLGPLSVSWAIPLNSQTGDETETFQFTLGRRFF